MTLFSRHLDVAALGLAVLDDAVNPRIEAHLGSCARCRRERAGIAAAFDEAWRGADDAVDAAFGPAELERQRQAILQRIAKTGGVARVLRFPQGADDPLPQPSRTEPRWLFAAAAAGLVLGLAAGQVPHLYDRGTTQVATGVARVNPSPAATQTADWRLDDTLLSEVDAALDGNPRPELEALDALTPVHYEPR